MAQKITKYLMKPDFENPEKFMDQLLEMYCKLTGRECTKEERDRLLEKARSLDRSGSADASKKPHSG